MITKCSICNKKFTVFSKDRKYCSVDCRELGKKNRPSAFNKKIKLCIKCNKNYTLSGWDKYCLDCSHIIFIEKIKEDKVGRKRRSLRRYNRLKNNPEYKKKHYESSKNAIKKRYKNDSNFNITTRLRMLFNGALNVYSKTGKIKPSKKYGIDYPKILEHLKPFPEDIRNYHIDHIIPLSSFNLENQEEIDIAFAPENHQWLLAKDNLSKGNKLNWIKN